MKASQSGRRLAALTLLPAFAWTPPAGLAESKAFTYQGQLKTNDTPVNGVFDFTFTLFRAAAAAVQELNRKLQSLEQQNVALLRRLEAMEARMK